ncbi:putative splicing factor u2af large subunit [Diplodia seriata]|uniref:Putative splicing factor u2af large subunit n=1 Tax=Diplodia seriata TaxID=420778 RepID=A0A0G2HC43_9PEZI|nr:putative splicing factor u2af large subunit [Diplodia seriata]
MNGDRERQRRMTQWDIKPPGYENVTAEQAKLSGMFPLPGAPRQQPMDPSRLQAFMNQPAGSASASALKPSNSRQAKRLFVYNFPTSATDDTIQDFFNLQLNHLNVISSSDPCISVQISKDRTFALCEFKTPEDTTMALALDGQSMEPEDASNGASNGAPTGLQISRPKDYIVPAQSEDPEYQEGVVSDKVKDGPHKISISQIPIYLTEEQVTELLTSFGELKAFVLAKDTGTEQSKGIAFCEYVDTKIHEDVHEECSKYGHVVDLKIPRPQPPKENKGVGKIFVKYDTPESAQKALRALAGRKFADRTVVVTFFGEVSVFPDDVA